MRHICAAFHLATTLVHEIAHLVYWQNFDNLNLFTATEPVVDNQPVMELGLAFVGSLFGGWNPEPIMFNRRIKSKSKYDDAFRYGMCWVKQLPYLEKGRPNWDMAYSMPFLDVQRIMSYRFWKGTEGKLTTSDSGPGSRLRLHFGKEEIPEEQGVRRENKRIHGYGYTTSPLIMCTRRLMRMTMKIGANFLPVTLRLDLTIRIGQLVVMTILHLLSWAPRILSTRSSPKAQKS
jgi:hypothetical protein